MKKTIYLLLFIIIVCSCILIYKIKQTSKYDAKLYEEIYSQYDEIMAEQSTLDTNNNYIPTQNKKKIYITSSANNIYRVIATIQIPKLNISYPIISEYNEEYLKLAPTKLLGPEPNQIGNFVITRT